MPFSRLLLMGANTRKYIVGKRHQDKVELKPKEALVSQASPHSDELALFFQIDEEKMRLGLRMIGDGVKCCDGLIFFKPERGGQARAYEKIQFQRRAHSYSQYA